MESFNSFVLHLMSPIIWDIDFKAQKYHGQ